MLNYGRILVFLMSFLVAACVTRPPQQYSPPPQHNKPTYSASSTRVFPDITHTYEIQVTDTSSHPIKGAVAVFIAKNVAKGTLTNSECTSDANGLCKIDVQVSQDPGHKYAEHYKSEVTYSISKQGFYTKSGKLSSSYGPTNWSIQKGAEKLYQASDYLSASFARSASDRALREQALKFVTLIRAQSLMVDADVMLGGIGVSQFKSKKYFQIGIDTKTTFNSLKLDKYAIAKRLFDDSIRKILNPLNENISNPNSFYGYDLIIFGYTKSFLDEEASPEKIQYRFLIPQETVRRYKNKDISGQQLLDASVILANDERIELKLQ